MDISVLIIDDEVELADSTAEYFNVFDVKSYAVYSAEEAERFLKDNNVKLILLDINLGNASGFELCKKIRRDYEDIPILFISARSSDDDMVIALNIGGDDYITKPYSLSVLFAKVKVVLKRYEKMTDLENQRLGQANAGIERDESLVYNIGNIEIDKEAGIVRKNGNIVELTAMEYRLLIYLLDNKNKIVSKQKIFDNVWYDSFVSDGTLNVHLRHIREKLEDDPNSPELIKTVRGMGLMLVE
ncbi:MAG: response regulator transcription factor [Eubacterium sp.]|nr:response regulator transcription factor [Eubacterium sp.]